MGTGWQLRPVPSRVRVEQLDIVPEPKHSDVTGIPLIRVTARVCKSTLRAICL